MSNGHKPMIQFTWDIHYQCNYRCPYCWFHGKWDDIACNNIYPGVPQLLRYWEKIHRDCGTVHIEIAGGEPLTYPGFPEFVRGLAQIHDIGVTSNLSVDVDAIVTGERKFNIGMSYHPLFADLETFFARAIKVKDNGFGRTVLYLAYPPQVERIPALKERFERAGFIFSVLTFWGKYQGRDYPAAYTPEEKRIIDTALGVRGESNDKFQLEPLVTRGKPCNAGHRYALVHPNGDAYRCGGGNWKDQHQPFGNVFTEDFRLLDRPEPCESEHCPCNEWSFLLAGKQAI